MIIKNDDDCLFVFIIRDSHKSKNSKGINKKYLNLVCYCLLINLYLIPIQFKYIN